MFILQLPLTFSELSHELFVLFYSFYYNEVLVCGWCFCALLFMAIARSSHFRFVSEDFLANIGNIVIVYCMMHGCFPSA